MIHAYQKQLKGNSIGIVFGSFAPLHQGHLDLIMQAKKLNSGGCIVIVCGHDNDKGGSLMPIDKRYRYIREFFAQDELVAVYGINETQLNIPQYPEGWTKWLEEVNNIWLKAVSNPFGSERRWYVGEPEYYQYLANIGETSILVDRVAENPISATKIRNNPMLYWNKITFPFKRIFGKNILICGTASEGKSTLTKDLGTYFNAPYSHEYAKQYMLESNIEEWEVTGTDFLAFLNGQYQLNKSLINSTANNGLFFADSDSMVTRMYAEYYSNDPDCAINPREFPAIAAAADEITAKCRWDKIYLIKPFGEYVDDHHRFMKFGEMEEREALYDILCNNLHNSNNWDKVTILDKGYWGNFKYIIDDIKRSYNIE